MMAKPFFSYQEQIQHLKRKCLEISDDSDAERILKQLGYFSLISGYKNPFQNKSVRKYKKGVRLEDIAALYYFDEDLRELFLKYILKIERHIRSLLSYHFTSKYGELQEEYLNAANYRQGKNSRKEIERFIKRLDFLANQNQEYPYINHQRDLYQNVPLWVLVNSLSFGTLSKFYEFTTLDLRSKVAQNFSKVNQKQLEQYLHVMTKFRNVCAHGERLYCYQTRNAIPDTPLHHKLNIAKQGTQYVLGKQDLFSMVIAFRYLLSDEDFKNFKKALKKRMATYWQESTAMSQQELYNQMGFPQNWDKITQYKK